MTKQFTPDRIEPSAGEIGVGVFRLGMPHLDAEGLRVGWLLRAACHRQWQEMSALAGVGPTGLVDADRQRVLGSVVASTVTGAPEAFREDDLCAFRLEVFPRAETGWRGKYSLTSQLGAQVSVEIVTRFVRRRGPSNTTLEVARMKRRFMRNRRGARDARTEHLLKLGAADRALAEANRMPPHQVVKIDRDMHLNGVGLVYFAEIHDMIARSEQRVVPELKRGWPLAKRRVHYHGNLDPGDTFEISVRTGIRELAPDAAIVVRSQGVRGSDGAIIAVAESIYEA